MKTETKVGVLAIVALALVLLFANMMGVLSPLSSTKELNVMYNYAGGIEEGSPVRVMGINVGKVKSISFTPDHRMPDGEEVKLKITISVEKKAWTSIRKNSKFFINMAGVIGEKFLEISPGNSSEPEFDPGDFVRGEDPPRIDQLISQGYGLAGKLIDFVDRNQGSVSNMISQLDRLVTNFNKTLAILEKTGNREDVNKLFSNAVKISEDVAYLTGVLRSKKSEETFSLIHRLLFRLEPVDGPLLRKFFQEEGVRARVL
ncbi:MAG: MlaD family protein [Bdellovibrionaceae bacterium]|nr:MlaD family protein [Pseudobdellovibrionaceae bacterium]